MSEATRKNMELVVARLEQITASESEFPADLKRLALDAQPCAQAVMIALLPSSSQVAKATPAQPELIAKLERVSRWIDNHPAGTNGATAMMMLLRDVKDALEITPGNARAEAFFANLPSSATALQK
jgi:hypothetical protein